MLFFRSEADLDTWLAATKADHGETLTVAQLWRLSERWYQDRMAAEYHGRTLAQAQEIFREVGLVSDFWKD